MPRKSLAPVFTPADKKFIYELWYTLGKPSLNALQKELKRLQAENKTPLTSTPVVATLANWKNSQDWEMMSKERDNLVQASLTNDAIGFQSKVYELLSGLTLQGLEAQSHILKAAKLDELSKEEARLLLQQAGFIGKDAVEQFKQAMVIAGAGDEYGAEKKPLAEILAWIDKATGDGDKVKTILAAKINK